MSFANRWLAYLKKQRMIPLVTLKSKIREDTCINEVSVRYGYVSQQYNMLETDELPDKISITPQDVDIVEILSAGIPGPYKFLVKKDGSIEVTHMNEMSDEEKRAMEEAAKKEEYTIVSFTRSSVL